MNPLNSFYQDVHQREAVKAFMIEQLEEMTIENVFNDKQITGLYEAKLLVDKMFNTLEETYKQKEKPVIKSMR